ncbi:hypothetical protein RCL1_004850 [Eukaryota sp. TZLM3-RCL]
MSSPHFSLAQQLTRFGTFEIENDTCFCDSFCLELVHLEIPNHALPTDRFISLFEEQSALSVAISSRCSDAMILQLTLKTGTSKLRMSMSTLNDKVYGVLVAESFNGNETAICSLGNQVAQLEEQLFIEREHSSQLLEAHETARLGFFKFSVKTNSICLSPIAREVLNVHGDCLDLTQFLSLFTENSRSQWKSSFQGCSLSGSSSSCQVELVLQSPPNSRTTYIVLRTQSGCFGFHQHYDVCGTVQDVTDMVEARISAEAGSQAKSLFLMTTSHELLTPLNTVVGLISLLESTPMTEEQRKMLLTIQHSSSSLVNLITNLLEFTKIESGKFELDIKEFKITDLIDLCVGIQSDKRFSYETSIEITSFVDPRLDMVLLGDVHRLEQILHNLVANALKFTHTGCVSVKVFCQKIVDSDVFIRLAVVDTGIGIDPSLHDKLFSAFSQVHPVASKVLGGIGLGLMISERIAKMMGSTIKVKSKVGKGSTFYLDLKLKRIGDISPPPMITNAEVFIVMKDCFTKIGLLKQIRALKGVVRDLYFHNSLSFAKYFEVCPLKQRLILVHAPILNLLDSSFFQCVCSQDLFVVLSGRGQHAEKLFTTPGIGKTMTLPFKFRELVDVLCNRLPSQEIVIGAPLLLRKPLNGGKFSLLVADDDILNRKVLTLLLESLGCHAETVKDGDEAVQVYQLNYTKFDLILMDYRMPYPGVNAARDVRAFEAEQSLAPIPIICLTADAAVETRAHAIEAGMNSYATKPVTKSSLSHLLDQFLPICTTTEGQCAL